MEQSRRGLIYVGLEPGESLDVPLDAAAALDAVLQCVRSGADAPQVGLCPELFGAVRAVRYVGKVDRTSRFPRRVKEHLSEVELCKAPQTPKKAWIQARVRQGSPPIFRVIDRLDPATIPPGMDPGGVLNGLERYWIAWFMAHGARLTNGTKGGDGLDPETARGLWRSVMNRLGKDGLSERARKIAASLGPDGLRERALVRQERLGPEGRSAAASKRQASLGPEKRRVWSLGVLEGMTPEQLTQRAEKINATLGEAGRKARAQKGADRISKEQRAGMMRKRVATARANSGRELPVGVYLHKRTGRYQARTSKMEFGYLKHIGTFDTPEQAAAALDAYRTKVRRG